MASVKIVARTNKKMLNDLYPISIRLSHKRQQTTYIRLKGYSCTLNNWNTELSRFNAKKENYKILNSELNEIEKRIDSTVESLISKNEFSYHRFKEKYLGETEINHLVLIGYKKKISELEQQNRIGTATFYKSSLAAVQAYTNINNFRFDEITYSFLNSFISHEIKRGVKSNSVAVYLKGLRSIHYTYCKINNLTLPSVYSRIGIQSLIKPTRKRSLSTKNLKLLTQYIPKDKHEQLAKDLFLFSFYCRGINLMDITKLTPKNIVNDRIEYTRSKTYGVFSIAITNEIKEILYRQSTEKFLFPIIKSDIPLRKAVKNYTKTINRILNRIAKRLEFPHDLTFLYARHTFAQLCRESGVSIELISKALGHSDLQTTEIYLKSFGNNEIDDISRKILDSLKE